MIYDKFAKNYDKAFAPFEKRFLSRWRGETLSHLPAGNPRILEIGAGTGLNFRFYPASCRRAVAGEISFKMLELARRKTAAVELVQTDAESLPFVANTFDAAFATLVFCSIPKPENAFAELRRVVKPNGKIVLLEHVRPNGAFGYAFDFLNIFTVALIEDHFNRRTAELAENAGLKILEVKRKALGIVNLIVCQVEK
ncbi:MAG TPA: methyltransferase domain-containing protein [Pyrinomonadaceae bacterium]|nr:methyltransferase domain-containing protein [Pyrinomonadaceae bacterium]